VLQGSSSPATRARGLGPIWVLAMDVDSLPRDRPGDVVVVGNRDDAQRGDRARRRRCW
jgi:hypothetical protein